MFHILRTGIKNEIISKDAIKTRIFKKEAG